MKKKRPARQVARAALIAALYVVLTVLASMLGLSSSAIQLRFSEALTVLPLFTSAAVPGLFIGCLLSNILTGAVIWDVIFGSLATLLGALGTRKLRHVLIAGKPYPALLPPIIANVLIVPFVLSYAYGLEDGIPFLMLTVGIGEILSVGGLGTILMTALYPRRNQIFQ